MTMTQPTLLFDGDCGFCKRCVQYINATLGDQVRCMPYQQAPEKNFANIQQSGLKKAVHLIDGKRVWVGAAAIFKVLALSKTWCWLWWCYQKAPLVATISEWVYGWVANHRHIVSKWLFPPTFFGPVKWLFRGLGAVYIVAFGSLVFQMEGLYASSGLLPINELITYAKSANWSVFQFPTLFWISDSDSMVQGIPILGVFAGVLMLVSSRPRLWALIAWVAYLSIVNAGRVFMSFQWDILLLEAGFLALFLNPSQPSRWVRWIFHWLLFRLMFASGMVKLKSGDLAWRDLTALTYHYWTQPIPHVISWWVDKLPVMVHKVSAFVMFGIELVVPWCIFGGRRLKRLAFIAINALMIGIIATGNYGFFNLLGMVISLLLLDDEDGRVIKCHFRRLVDSITSRIGCLKKGDCCKMPDSSPLTCNEYIFSETKHRRRYFAAVSQCGYPLLVMVIIISSFSMDLNRFLPSWCRIATRNPLVTYIQPFHVINGYGLFASMTKKRPELIFQGSLDGHHWETYEFKWKATSLYRMPQWAFPYHPRLDWQLWFAALGKIENSPWVYRVVQQLFNNNPSLLNLMSHNPFVGTTPYYIRILKADYQFTSMDEWQETSQWWKREKSHLFSPVFKR